MAVERLQDLDALLLADRDVLDPRVGVDREPELLGDLANTLPRCGPVEEHLRLCRLVGEDDVLGHGHHRDQHEMLVDHSDPVLDRVARRREGDPLSLDQDLALVGVVQAVEDVHQRRLSGAVLAEQRVHLSLAQVEVDVVVCKYPGKALRDSPELEQRRLRRHGRNPRGRDRARPLEPCAD